ncbi:MAG: MBL fold metallo-hydrolase [Acaryochloris sp. RU_4_1]|nr:MBL fold metallo-hydrolase [Acaryochloris sp. RU_4_1]NJR56009.1 MBL fold metallo-hydrolase [Acaryochloris sp. CRU_2_0]
MEFPELFILDVGHGNCALLRDTEGVVLIDCPPGSVLPELLGYLGITEIAHVLISHADQDHIAGIPQLLLNKSIKVNNIYLNSDWLRNTDVWKDVRTALGDARKRSEVNIEAQLTTSITGRLNVGQVSVEVLAPVPELALEGVGGKDLAGRTLGANSISAVVSLGYNTRRVAILAGDLDQTGLDNLLKETENLQAEILVFPHHGGRPGAGVDSKAFAQQLCNLVQPRLVIFSIDRSLHKNPKDEIVEGVLSAVPEAHVICTQLSEKCALNLPNGDPIHLNSLSAKGRTGKKCCGGTILIKVDKTGTVYIPSADSHQEFVTQFPNALCRKFLH